jgi:16S rRNA (guanine527-N7)-methyltransferase
MTLETDLAAYQELLSSWAPRLDLISPGDLERLRERHIEDALKALPLVRAAPAGWGIDVGAGAGLPGVPLALADRSRRWRLLEPRAKRAAFLEEVVRSLRLDCEVVVRRAEAAAADPALAAGHAIATARALAAPARAFSLLAPLLAPGGVALVWVGKDARIPPEAEEPAPGLATVTF